MSADSEYVHPRFGSRAIPGVYVPAAGEKNTVRFGLVMQYQRNPVTAYRLDEEVGLIVANRFVGHIGVSWDFAEWGSARVVAPAAVNWGTQFPDFRAEGFGMGDISLGAQFLPYRSRQFNVGLYGDVIFPSGTAQAYFGEPGVRGEAGVQMMGMIGMGELVTLDIVGDVAVIARPVESTNQDFDKGPELKLSEGLRLNLAWVPFEMAITQALVARSGFTNFFGGGAESGVELYGGIQIPFRNVANFTDITLDAMVGRGATEGYGTTDLRVLAGLTFTRNPGRIERNEKVVLEKPPPRIPDPPRAEPPEDPPIVENTETEIVIRDPIEFFVNTADIRPDSLPLLQNVADVINADARIKHIVVEGHASEEGDLVYNYELSKKRAESVYKQLIVNGVAPDRLSYRGKGEVEPKVEGNDEDAWQYNRRVEFKVVARFPSDTVDYPTYVPSAKTPWAPGEVQVITPLTPDEQEQERLKQFYEDQQKKEQRDSFQEPVDDKAFNFEGDGAPAEGAPAEEASAEEASAEEASAEEAPPTDAPPAVEAREADAFDGLDFDENAPRAAEPPPEPPPAEEAPADEAPADEAPADEAPADEAPADEAPAEESAPEGDEAPSGEDAPEDAP